MSARGYVDGLGERQACDLEDAAPVAVPQPLRWRLVDPYPLRLSNPHASPHMACIHVVHVAYGRLSIHVHGACAVDPYPQRPSTPVTPACACSMHTVCITAVCACSMQYAACRMRMQHAACIQQCLAPTPNPHPTRPGGGANCPRRGDYVCRPTSSVSTSPVFLMPIRAVCTPLVTFLAHPVLTSREPNP